MNKELWKCTKQRRIRGGSADQERQVRMAGPYTRKTVRRYSQASSRVESPRKTGKGETEEYMAKNGARKGQRS
jgi:hypothetical protein